MGVEGAVGPFSASAHTHFRLFDRPLSAQNHTEVDTNDLSLFTLVERGAAGRSRRAGHGGSALNCASD